MTTVRLVGAVVAEREGSNAVGADAESAGFDVADACWVDAQFLACFPGVEASALAQFSQLST